MDRKRVLVFPCGSEIGSEHYRALSCAKEIDLWGGSSIADHGKFLYKQYISDIPFVTDKVFVSHINRIVKKYKFDYIVPAHDSVVIKLAEAYHYHKLLCPVLTSPLSTCRVARSKKITMKLFENIITTPRIYKDPLEIDEWPVFLKPDVGEGSRGAVIAESHEEVFYFLNNTSDLLIFEYLPGLEYTVDCFTDRNRTLIFAEGRQRCRISGGISVNTKPAKFYDFKKIANIINGLLHLRGVWFFQVKQNSGGDLALMEIAPRLAGTMGMYRNLGINFSLMSIYDAEGFDLKPLINSFDIEMDRAWGAKFSMNIEYTDVYIDFDDCLVLNDKVNTQAISFMYQCINKGIRIHLITKHSEDLNSSLEKYRISGIFNSIIRLNKGEKKSKKIKSKKSIFIDDSFSERMDVKKNCGIPVFAPDSIESLME